MAVRHRAFSYCARQDLSDCPNACAAVGIACRKNIVMQIHIGNQLEDHTHNKLFIWCLNRADCVVLLEELYRTILPE